MFTKHKPLDVSYGMGIEKHDQEGRVITLEYEDYYIVTVYTPNAQNAVSYTHLHDLLIIVVEFLPDLK